MKTKTRIGQKSDQNPLASGPKQSVSERAYELYLQGGQKSGRDLDDWLQAERELADQNQKPQ